MADRKRILIVDDDPDLVGVLQVDLERRGYEIVAVTDSRKALDIAKARRFDLLLVDVLMPGITGYEIATATHSGTAAAPKIILMTCLDARRESGLALLSGVSAMVQKPFTLEALHRKILDVLENPGN